MKCKKTYFLGKIRTNIANKSSAELAQRMVKVNKYRGKFCFSTIFSGAIAIEVKFAVMYYRPSVKS